MRADAGAEGPPKGRRWPGQGPALQQTGKIEATAKNSDAAAARQRAARYLRRRFALSWPTAFVIAEAAGPGGGHG